MERILNYLDLPPQERDAVCKQLRSLGCSPAHGTRRTMKKEMEKLERNLGGIKEMNELPGVIFLVDPKKERIAILEAKKLGIPVVGLVDTNCNPEDVDYAIPGNDDAIRAVKLIMDVMANAVIEGRQGESMEQEVDEQEQMAEDAKPESIEEVVAAEAEENK